MSESVRLTDFALDELATELDDRHRANLATSMAGVETKKIV